MLCALALEEATYGWAVEMILKGAIAGFRIVEVPLSYYPSVGKSKIGGTVRGTLIQLARELRLTPAKAPRTAAWSGEWEQAAAHLCHCLGEL